MKFMPILICCLLLNSQCIINATALRLAHSQDSSNVTIGGLTEGNEKIHSRQKREPITAALALTLLGILASAATTAGSVILTEEHRASAPDECAVTIAYRYNQRPNAILANGLEMYFKTDLDTNRNHEQLQGVNGVDRTKEKVDGGFLQRIDMKALGEYCVRGIFFSCGSQLTRRFQERSLIIDVATIRKTLSRYRNFRDIKVTGDCIWFSLYNPRGIKEITLSANAFTQCENANEDCISRHLIVS